MRTSLVPCPSCHRHVRATESACPFCHGDLPVTLAAQAVPGTTQRLSRAAAFTFAATLAATGCGPTATPDDAAADTGPTTTDVVTVTDRPVTTDNPVATDNPTVTDTGTHTDAGPTSDDGGFLAMYGGPPRDAGPQTDSGPPDDHGGIVPLYGLPRDAGPINDDAATNTDSGAPEDHGSVMALYGAVPFDAGSDGSIGVRYGSPPRPDSGA